MFHFVGFASNARCYHIKRLLKLLVREVPASIGLVSFSRNWFLIGRKGAFRSLVSHVSRPGVASLQSKLHISLRHQMGLGIKKAARRKPD